jgi:23S rRNA pseudouridine1911/1915/1917 synthase
VEWTASRTLSWQETLREARARLGPDGEALERALHHGGVALDGRPLGAGPAPARVGVGTRISVHALLAEPAAVPLPEDALLWDRDGVVAAAKPPWLPTQRTRASDRASLERALAERLGAPGLRAVHRLDRPTSGVVLLARDGPTAARLGAALREPGTVRRYLAWVAPGPAAERFRVAGWMGRVPDPARYRFALREPRPGRHPFRIARWSATVFRVLHRADGRALVLAEPETGRTHQIRVHLAAAGSPVVGDDLYGPPWRAGAPSAAGRALLHAASIRVRRGGRRLEIDAPLPADFPRPAAP